MSTGHESHLDPRQIEQARQQINRLAEEIAQLSDADLAPPEYYGEFLTRILAAIQAPAGAIWLRTPQGNLQQQYQINMRQVGLDKGENTRQMHDELLRQTAMKGAAGIFSPNSGVGQNGPGNPTDFVILLAPIIHDKQVAGLVEIWQDPTRGPDAQRGFLQFVIRMAALASGYTRNHQLRQMVGQQQVWVQLEAFAKLIHGTLQPTEVAYLVANEGRRLVEADRVSVALREARKPRVEAISGADIVEKRSNLVQLMRALFEAVMKWGERLVYSGTKDDTLPPAVLEALDNYLGESNSKVLVVMPLKDEREEKSKQMPRSAIMMECFETTSSPDQLIARLEVIGRHATPALYNAAEYRRIPMRFLWMPLAKLQEGLGGKTRAIIWLVVVGLVALGFALVFVPYPLKMDAKGSILPIERAFIYPPTAGHVKWIKPGIKSGSHVYKDMELIAMYNPSLAGTITKLKMEIDQAEATMKAIPAGGQQNDQAVKRQEASISYHAKSAELEKTLKMNNASSKTPGEFYLKAPMSGIILTADFRENLLNRFVKENEPLLRIGRTDAANPRIEDWEIELKIPQKHIGQVKAAFDKMKVEELDVDILLVSAPTQTFKGKLARNKIAFQAQANRDDQADPEPIVTAWVRVAGADIPPEYQIPASGVLLTGTEVHSRIRCGNYALGYSFFYGVWEFIYEKVFFPLGL